MITIPSLIRLSLICFLAANLAACGKKDDAAPSAEQRQAEKAAADKSVRDNAVWGEQVKALDKAKELQKTMEKQAAELAKKADEDSK